MAIGSLKQNSLTFPWLLAQNKIPWLFPDFSLTIIFFPVFPVFQTLWEPCKGHSDESSLMSGHSDERTPLWSRYLYQCQRTCDVGTLSLIHWGVPWRQVLLYLYIPRQSSDPSITNRWLCREAQLICNYRFGLHSDVHIHQQFEAGL